MDWVRKNWKRVRERREGEREGWRETENGKLFGERWVDIKARVERKAVRERKRKGREG